MKDKLIHKFMLAEAHMLGRVSGGNPARQLVSKPDVIDMIKDGANGRFRRLRLIREARSKEKNRL